LARAIARILGRTGTLRLILVIAALLATPFARLASQADSSTSRFAWDWAELLTFADSNEGVRLWLTPRPHVPYREDVQKIEVNDAFDPDSVNVWVNAARANRISNVTAARTRAETIVPSNALRGRDATQIVIEFAPGGDSSQDASDVLITPQRGVPLRFALEPDQIDRFLRALAKAAMTSHMSQQTASVHVRPAALDPNSSKARLRYPEDLKDQRIEGEVWAQFDIDTSGVADTSTFRVLFANHQQFELAVRQYLGKCRFAPELRNGVPVRTRAQQLFRFLFDD
jgi:hypothetical protein